MLAWMVYAMLATAALGVTAWLVDFAVAGRLGRRRVLWAGVFLASAVGPVVFSVTRGVPAAVAEEGVGAAPAASGRREPVVSDRVLISAWLAMSAVFALWLVATQRRLRRRLRVYPSRVVDGERVLVSDFGPVVVGIVRPQIVLPEWALAMRDSDRRIIVAHETEHRRARDPLLAAVALLVVAALPWNAALWWQLRRLRLAIEIDCDRRVVSRHGHDPHAYGMLLLATRERASRLTPGMAMAMAAMRSGLGRRVEALVDGRPRSAARRLSALATAVVLAAGIVSVPAPRLSLIRAAVVDASAAAPLASSTTPSAPPPGPRQASTPWDAGRSAAAAPMHPQRALRLVRSGSSLRAIVVPTTPPAVEPPRQGRTGSREGRGDGRSGSASTVEGYRILPSAVANRMIYVPRWAPNRAILLPIPASLQPPPR
jgi:beta-lactamase regulating signal transducer with metallopeptidase domain